MPGVAVAEDARRITNVRVTASIAGRTITVDAGPVVFHSADPILGEQNRPIGGVPAVTLAFDRGLEWMIANKPLDHLMRVTIKSFASTPRTFSFKVVSPEGVRVDSIPASMTLQANEEKELFVRVRGPAQAGALRVRHRRRDGERPVHGRLQGHRVRAHPSPSACIATRRSTCRPWTSRSRRR